MHVKVSGGEIVAFPYGINDLMRDNPNTSFPEQVSDAFLAQYGIFPVTPNEIPQPFDSIKQNAVQADPVLVKGEWVQTWKVTTAPAQEVARRAAILAENIRAERDQKLAACDWTQLADAPVDRAAWAAYRAALRDLPKQKTFPYSVIWPTQPE